MKRIKYTIMIVILAIISALSFSACSLLPSNDVRSIVSIEKESSDGLVDTYVITYSDGTTTFFTVTNGKDGQDGENGTVGQSGEKGDDGLDGVGIVSATVNSNGELIIALSDGSSKNCGIVTGEKGESGEDAVGILDISINTNGELVITMDDSSQKNLGKVVGENGKDGANGKDGKDGTSGSSTVTIDYSKMANKMALSTFVVFSEFTKTESSKKAITVGGGSAVLYKIVGNDAFLITNYHVINSDETNEDCEGGYARKVVCYLYGSLINVGKTGNTGLDGYEEVAYLGQPIECSIYGASPLNDIAILKADANYIKSLNSDVVEIEFAESYHVGETAIAIGNIEGEGLSVTQGIISVIGETVTLTVGGVSRDYTELRIDTSIYQGSSGGGLFNKEGKLIGITNAGNLSKQNINYALPCDIVKVAVENIMEYADGVNKNAKKIVFGVTIYKTSSKFSYDEESGYGELIEENTVESCITNSIADKLGLLANDIILCFKINGKEIVLKRQYQIGLLTQRVRENDVITFKVKRGDIETYVNNYTIIASDLIDIT